MKDTIKHQGRVEARHEMGGYNAAAHRILATEQADHCARWLKAQGLEVLFVVHPRPAPPAVRALPPRIHIRPCALCDKIEGAVQMYMRGPSGELRYKMALRMGCEVRWADTGINTAGPEQEPAP